jgi:hypothetical protein
MKLSLKKHILAVIIFTTISLLFHSKLIFPSSSIYFTPDYGQSDIWHLNYALKFNLAQALKSNSIPLWSNQVGSGYPLLAEGQTGAFNLFNLTAFKLLPPLLAFNLGYIFIFAFTSIGMYLLLKTLKFDYLLSLIGGFVMAFSGYFISHINHFNLIQASSFLPWILLFVTKFIKTGRISWLFIYCFFSFQQLVSGFPQLSFITHVILFTFVFYITKVKTFKFAFKLFFVIGMFAFLSIGLAAIQVLPTVELTQHSVRKSGLPYTEVTRFPYPFKHLITMVVPFGLGNPKHGTYPQFNKDWGIFWENTAYIGILPLVGSLLALIFVKKCQKIKKASVLTLFFLLLVFGKYSPLYFVFTVFPFNLFRVPSRFLIGIIFYLVLMFLIFLQKAHIKTRNKIYILLSIFFLTLIDIFSVWYNYHPTVNHTSLPPPNPKVLNPKDKYYTLENPTHSLWNSYFWNKGWIDIEPYIFLTKARTGNSSLLENLKSINFYRSINTDKANQEHSLLNEGTELITQDTPSTAAAKRFSSLLAILGANTVLSPQPINLSGYQQVYNYSYDNNLSIFVYKNEKVATDYYSSTNLIKATTINSFTNSLLTAETNNLPIYIPAALEIQKVNKLDIKPAIVQNGYQEYIVSNGPGIFVLKQSFYPGWEVFIDGKEEKIFRANINQTAVVIPEGNHKVVFQYKPSSYSLGRTISICSFTVWAIFLFLFRYKNLSIVGPVSRR